MSENKLNKMENKGLLKNLLDLFFVFFKIGAFTFGGGLAMLPILEKDLVDKLKWSTREELMDFYAISQSTPGIVAVNVATFIGYKRCGIIGGIIGTLGVVTPSIIIITLIALFLQNFMDISWVQKAMAGINVAVAALLTKAVWTFAQKGVKNLLGFILFIVAFLLMAFLNVNTIFIIIGSALVGIISFVLASKKEIEEK